MTPTDTTIQILLPVLGESVTEGTVIEWRKAVGDAVAEGETLLDVTTDKVDVEIPSPAGGVLTAIAAEPGAAVEVGQLLGEIAAGNGVPPAAPASVAGGDAAGNGASAPGSADALVPIQLPDMESVTEGTVLEWKKAVGDPAGEAQGLGRVILHVNFESVAGQFGEGVDLLFGDGKGPGLEPVAFSQEIEIMDAARKAAPMSGG